MKKHAIALAFASFASLGLSALALAKTPPAPAKTVELSVTEDGFEPANAKVKVGERVQLVVTRKTEKTCATELVMADYNIKVALPLNKAVTIPLEPKKTGVIKYGCGMNMITAVLTVE